MDKTRGDFSIWTSIVGVCRNSFSAEKYFIFSVKNVVSEAYLQKYGIAYVNTLYITFYSRLISFCIFLL